MLQILKKYNQLPQEIKDRMSSKTVLAAVRELEIRYGINLHSIIMRIMVGDISIDNLVTFFTKDLKQDLTQARNLAQKLKDIVGEQKKVIAKPVVANNKSTEQESLDAFSAEDEEEIKQIMQSAGDADSSTSYNQNEKVNTIFEQLSISFSSQFLLDKFKKIIKSSLSGVKHIDDIFAILLAPFDKGGIGLSKEEATKVVNLLNEVKREEIKKEKDSKAALVSPKPKVVPQEIVRDVEYNLEKEIQNNQNTKVSAPPLQKSKQEVQEPDSIATQAVQAKENISPKPESIKPKTESKPHTMSPVDELRYLSLIDFRRLHEDPAKAIIKVQEKINLLAGYKYDQKVEGLKAWRSSPVNQIYLKIGQISINEAKPINDVIYILGNEKSLSQKEFDAIGQLNYLLRTN